MTSRRRHRWSRTGTGYCVVCGLRRVLYAGARFYHYEPGENMIGHPNKCPPCKPETDDE